MMGAEGAGIRAGIRKKCDFLAEIPAPLSDLSLNVAVATGICLYEVNQQRGRR
ncbi:MAG: TrmH family RNA methyltransferase [Pseudomonadales bacterium]